MKAAGCQRNGLIILIDDHHDSCIIIKPEVDVDAVDGHIVSEFARVDGARALAEVEQGLDEVLRIFLRLG